MTPNQNLADELEKLCCAETEVKFFDCITYNIETIIKALRSTAATVSRDREAIAKTAQQFWQGPSGRAWDGDEKSCCVALPAQAEWFRKLADAILSLNPVGADGPWCQPMDQGKHTPRRFIVMFEDADRGYSLFDNEAEAREFFNRANTAWNCWLFGALPLNEATPVSDAGVVVMREALEHVDRRLNQIQPGHSPRANELVNELRPVVRKALSTLPEDKG